MAYEVQIKVNPGSLRTPLLFKRLEEGKDEDNRPTKALKVIHSCKGKVSTYKGKEALEAQGQVYIEQKKVIMRVPKVSILDTDCVFINDKKYEITSIIDIEERGKYYELKIRYVK